MSAASKVALSESDAVAREAYGRGFRVGATDRVLRALLEETLATPGGLTRLKLAWLVGRVVGLPATTGITLATGIEYFHTASLLLDDLPCMDDASHRRGVACAHRKYGEAAAILGSLAFVNRAYALLGEAFIGVAEPGRSRAAAHAARCLGEAGVLGGQALDLHFASSDHSPRAVGRAAVGKTVTLLRLALVTPALAAGVCGSEILLLHRLSVYWGLAYQIADDCSDLLSDVQTGKTSGRDSLLDRPNFALAAGPVGTVHRLGHLLTRIEGTLRELEAVRSAWSVLQPLVTRLVRATPAESVERCA
ncbi:(2E,6E)-farnesyl diphosphate synthase [Opitutales bacterium ASA1]|uniref:polyprenyl synthetase family protein n=1 Tax=Congregicoccus parvus TaxID=3081749 RepID=UPI002B2A34F3|nr:(2E,6E)-farnesyl diphosphate synthase [Opitutales bacterium ASA1]